MDGDRQQLVLPEEHPWSELGIQKQHRIYMDEHDMQVEFLR